MGNNPACCTGRSSDVQRLVDSTPSKAADVLPDTSEFEGFKVVPKFWTIYTKAERMEKLSEALQKWRQLRAALSDSHSEDGRNLLEAEEMAQLVKTFLRYDKNRDRQLQWATGEVRNFIRSSFKNSGLPPPPIGKNAWLLLYREYETEGTVRYDFKKSTTFLVHVAETIQSLASGAGLPIEVSPWVFIMWRPTECQLEQVKADALADMHFWKVAEVFEREGIGADPEVLVEKQEDADFSDDGGIRDEKEEPETEVPQVITDLKDYWTAQAVELEKAWKQLKDFQQLEESQKKQQDLAIKSLVERQNALREREAQERAEAERTAAEKRDIRTKLSSLTAQLCSNSSSCDVSPSNRAVDSASA